MADKDRINQEMQNSQSSDNLFPDEWTLIDENYSDKEDNEENGNGADSVEDGERIVRQNIEVLEVSGNDRKDEDNESAIVEKQGEDSDGISVITESDGEQLIERKNFEETDNCQDYLCRALNLYEKLGERSTPQVGTILNVVVACSLAAIIGLGAGRILGMDDKCPVTNSIDFSTIKMESDMLINQIRELGEVKNVLDEIKASIPQMKEKQERISHDGSKSRSKRAEQRKKSLEISETYTFNPDNTVLEQLQTSLITLCSVIDDIKPENKIVSSDASRARDIVADLIKFKGIIDAVIKKLEDTGEEKELEFFRNSEKKIRDVCKSLLDELTRTINGLTGKMHKKLNKVRQKLNKRLCLLKISESIDGKLFKPLEEKNSFLESCDKVLNAAFKSQRVKISKKEMSEKEIDPKINSLNDTSVIKSSELEDGYSKYSSSDSSMPDLTYNRESDNGFLKEKRNSRRKEKNGKKKYGKSTVRVGKKSGKVKSFDPPKPGGDSQNWKNLMTDAMKAEETSLFTQEPRFELPVLKERPLYSSVVKSIGGDIESKLDNSEKQKPDRKEFKDEVSNEDKENSIEMKHNVTPAESDVNVLPKIKNTKKQRNANIRKPIDKHDKVRQLKNISQHKKIVSKGSDDLQQTENIEKISSGTAAAKADEKTKKFNNNNNNFDVSSESENKKSTDDNNNTYDSIPDDKSEKISINGEGKKRKREKAGRKNASSPKIMTTKSEKDSKNRNDKQRNTNDQFAEDWQLQRSRAREMHRDRDHRSEWFFDRAGHRQNIRKVFTAAESADNCWKGKCLPIFNEEKDDEKYFDEWFEFKEMKARKNSDGHAGFTAKKIFKRPHRENIMQSKRR